MADPNLNLLLAGNMRVVRDQISTADLQSAFPRLAAQSLSDPSSLTDADRRLLLDFPPANEEAINLSHVTTKTRAQLLVSTVDSPEDLTGPELDLVRNRFWLDITPEEIRARAAPFSQLAQADMEVLAEASEALQAALAPAYLPHEKEAIDSAHMVESRRVLAEADAYQKQLGGGQAALDRARPWVRQLHAAVAEGGDREEPRWGLACYLDASAQALAPDELEEFMARIDGVLAGVQLATGAKAGPAAIKWMLQYLDDGPAVIATLDNGSIDLVGVHAFRHHFAQVLTRPLRQRNPRTHMIEGAGLAPGILKNTFLVVDQVCIDSVVAGTGIADDMIILAVEHPYAADTDHAVPNQTDAYSGYTWVRIPQICHHFYEQRWLHGDDNDGMRRIWESAQRSRNQAFVSMDADEAQMFKVDRTSASAL